MRKNESEHPEERKRKQSDSTARVDFAQEEGDPRRRTLVSTVYIDILFVVMLSLLGQASVVRVHPLNYHKGNFKCKDPPAPIPGAKEVLTLSLRARLFRITKWGQVRTAPLCVMSDIKKPVN
jgi:hypothetical protein